LPGSASSPDPPPSEEERPLRFVFLADPASVHTVRLTGGLASRGHRVVIIPNNERGYVGPAKLLPWLRAQ
jgi:hypothetical protein